MAKRVSSGLRTSVEVVTPTEDEQKTRQPQRLVLSSSQSSAPIYIGDPLAEKLATAQAVLYQNQRIIGRLVHPRVLVEGESSVAQVSLLFDCWQPLAPDCKKKLGPETSLCLPADDSYKTSTFAISLFAKDSQGSSCLPISFTFSGRDTAASLSTHLQRLEYIRAQQRRFSQSHGDSPVRKGFAWSEAEHTVETGVDWEKCLLSFRLAATPWLQRVVLKLVVIQAKPVDDSGSPSAHNRTTVSSHSSGAASASIAAMASAPAEPVPQPQPVQQHAGSKDKPAVDERHGRASYSGSELGLQHMRRSVDGSGRSDEVVPVRYEHGLETTVPASPPGMGHGASVLRTDVPAGGAIGNHRGEQHSEGRACDLQGGCAAPSSRARPPLEESAEVSVGVRGGQVGYGFTNGCGPEQAHGKRESGRHRKSEGCVDSQSAPQPLSESTLIAAQNIPVSSTCLSDRGVLRMADSLRDGGGFYATESQARSMPSSLPDTKPTVKLISASTGAVGQGGDGDPAAVPSLQGVSSSVPTSCGMGCTASEGGGAAYVGRCGGGPGAAGPRARDDSLNGVGGSAVPTVPRQHEGDSVGRGGPQPDSPGAVLPAASWSPAHSGTDCPQSDGIESTAGGKPGTSGPHGGSTQPKQGPARSKADDAAPSDASEQVVPQAPAMPRGPPYPNGMWLHPQTKAGPYAFDHGPPHGGSYPPSNGKLRNGEMDASLLAQQLASYVGVLSASPGHSPLGSSPQGTHTHTLQPQQMPHLPMLQPQPLHPLPHPSGVGLDPAFLQQVLLAQQHAPMQPVMSMAPSSSGSIPTSPGVAGGGHPHPHAGIYGGWPQAQQQGPALHPSSQHALQHQQLFQQALQHQLLQQHMMQVAAVQQRHHHQQQQQQVLPQVQAPQQQEYPAAMQQGVSQTYVQQDAPAAESFDHAVSGGTGVQGLSSDALQTPLDVPLELFKGTAGLISPVAVVPQHPHLGPSSATAGPSVQPYDVASAPSTPSGRKEAAAPPGPDQRPMGPQHRAQSQGNILAPMQGAAGGGSGQGHMREGPGGGGGRSASSYRNRPSVNGGLGGGSALGAHAGGPHGGGGQAYGGRQYGGGQQGQPRGYAGGAQGFVRGPQGGRYDGSMPSGSADSSRPSSRGPHPQQQYQQSAGNYRQHPVSGAAPANSTDPVPPPDALPLPDPKGSCDLDRFISQIEPVIAIDPAKPPQQALQDLRLRDLWNFYFEPSIYGREVFTLGGHRGASNSYFVPYLSAIQIFMSASPSDVGGTNRLYVSENNSNWPKHMHLKFEYFEQELPFNRLPLYDQMELLAGNMAAAAAAKASATAQKGQSSAAAATAAQPAVASQIPSAAPAAAAGSGSGDAAAAVAAPATAGSAASRNASSRASSAAPSVAASVDGDRSAPGSVRVSEAGEDGSPPVAPGSATPPSGEPDAATAMDCGSAPAGDQQPLPSPTSGSGSSGDTAEPADVTPSSSPSSSSTSKDSVAASAGAGGSPPAPPGSADSSHEGAAISSNGDTVAAPASSEGAVADAPADGVDSESSSKLAEASDAAAPAAASPAAGSTTSDVDAGAPAASAAAGSAPATAPAPGSAAPAAAAGATAPSSSAASGTAPAIGSGGLLYDMRLVDIHPASWFAVAWYPVYRIPDAPLFARFLTFHSFAPLVESMRNAHERLAMGQVAPYYPILSLPVVGLNWYNMQGERWLEPLDESAVATAHPGLPPGAGSSPRAPPGRAPRSSGPDVWYQGFLHNLQGTADRLARGVGLRVLGQHGAEEVRLRVPDYEFFRARG